MGLRALVAISHATNVHLAREMHERERETLDRRLTYVND